MIIHTCVELVYMRVKLEQNLLALAIAPYIRLLNNSEPFFVPAEGQLLGGWPRSITLLMANFLSNATTTLEGTLHLDEPDAVCR